MIYFSRLDLVVVPLIRSALTPPRFRGNKTSSHELGVIEQFSRGLAATFRSQSNQIREHTGNKQIVDLDRQI